MENPESPKKTTSEIIEPTIEDTKRVVREHSTMTDEEIEEIYDPPPPPPEPIPEPPQPDYVDVAIIDRGAAGDLEEEIIQFEQEISKKFSLLVKTYPHIKRIKAFDGTIEEYGKKSEMMQPIQNRYAMEMAGDWDNYAAGFESDQMKILDQELFDELLSIL